MKNFGTVIDNFDAVTKQYVDNKVPTDEHIKGIKVDNATSADTAKKVKNAFTYKAHNKAAGTVVPITYDGSEAASLDFSADDFAYDYSSGKDIKVKLVDKDYATTGQVNAKYTKPESGIPKSDLATDVQTSLDKADSALQSAPVTSVNGKTGAVQLGASDVGALPTSTKYVVSVNGESGEVKNIAKTNSANTFIGDQTVTGNGSVSGNFTVGGNLTINGTTTTVDSTTLQVKDKLIEVAHGNTTTLTTPAGLVAPKYDGTNSGALVFDSTGTAYVGDVTLKDGNIDVANSGLQPLATRTGLVGGNLVQYDSSAQTLKDSGKKISDLALKTDISGKLSKTENTGVSVLGTTKATTTLGGNQLVAPNGIIFAGTAANAGLVTRGICGVSTPDSNGACSKENLYINYDGNNDFNVGRQVVLNAGTVGNHLGSNMYQYTAPRGEIVKNWVEAKGYATTSQVNEKQNAITDSNKLSASLVSGLATVATSGSYNDLSNKPTIPDVSGKANLSGGNTFSGVQTINAPTNVSGSEQTTMKVKTSNGGAIIFGKEGANSGTMIRLDQADGTCRLRFGSSATAGAMVWEQPENSAQLYVDLGAKGSDYHRVQFPSGSGTLALTSQIPTNYVTTDTEQTISGAKTFTSDVVVNKTTPRFDIKLSGLTNGTAPSANQYGELRFVDKNGVYEGGIRFDSPTDGENRTKLSTNSFGTTYSNYVGLFAQKNASSATAADIWKFVPSQDAVIDLGSSDLRWRNVRAVTTYSNIYGGDVCSTNSLRLKDSNITRGTNQAASGGKQNYYRAININDKNNHKGVAVEWGYLCEKNSNGNTTKHVSELNLLVYPPNTTDNANFVKVALGKRSDGTTYFTYAGDQVITTKNFSLSGTTLTITL